MIYLLSDSYLPWSDFHKKFKDANFEFKDFLRERLEIKYTKEVFKLAPKSLREILKRVLTLQFDEEPPYDEIIEKLKFEIQKEIKLGRDLQPIIHQFEWTLNHASRIKANIIKEAIKFESKESVNAKQGPFSDKTTGQDSSSGLLFNGQSRALSKEAVNLVHGSQLMRNQLNQQIVIKASTFSNSGSGTYQQVFAQNAMNNDHSNSELKSFTDDGSVYPIGSI